MDYHRRLYGWMALVFFTLVLGCSESAHDFGFSIVADPARSHAPSLVRFELLRDDGVPLHGCTADWNYGDGVAMTGSLDAERRYQAAGKYRVEVSLRCGLESSAATTTVEIFDTIDLAVGSVSARPLNVSTDGQMTVSFQLSNTAKSPLRVATVVDVYLSPSNSTQGYLEGGAVRIYRQTLSSFPSVDEADSTQRMTYEISLSPVIRTGVYYVVVVVNPDANVGESDRSNNVAISDVAVTVRNSSTDGADLVAANLQMKPSVTGVLSAASAYFEIFNQGSTTDEVFWYEIWMGEKDNAHDMHGATLVSAARVEGSLAGVRQVFQDVLLPVTPPIWEPGLYYFWLKVDATDVIAERDKTNNITRSVAPIQVTNEPILDADIIVDRVDFSPGSASPGGTISVSVSVYNQGSQPTGSFVCTVFLSRDMSFDPTKDIVVGSLNVDDLAPMSGRTLSTIAEIDGRVTAGMYWVYVFCDSTGVVAEANEDNNIQRSLEQLQIVSEASVDLLFGPIRMLSDSTLSDGASVSLLANLCNQGKTGAGPSVVSLVRENMCSGTRQELLRERVGGVEPNDCLSVPLEVPMVCDFWCPYYRLHLIADATQVIDETDKTNNSAVVSPNIVMQGEDCQCQGDAFEPNNLLSEASVVGNLEAALTLCHDDVDWYRLDMSQNQHFEVHLKHDRQRGPLRLELWRGVEQITHYVGSDDLYLSGTRVTNADTLPVYMRVVGQNGGANHYHLSLSIYGNQTGVDLSASGLQIEEGALSLTAYRNVSVILDNLGTEASGATTLGYYLSRTGNIDETAFRLASQPVAAMPAGSQRSVSISLKLPPDTVSGSYHLVARVDDEAILNDVRRSNNVARSSAWIIDRACWDRFDPNDSFEDAAVLDLSSQSFFADDLRVCKAKRDFYRLDIRHGMSLDIAVTGKTHGDFDIVLYDHAYNEITSSRTGKATETIHRDIVVGDQILYLEVFLLNSPYNPDELRYALDIRTASAASWLTCLATFEPNDFFSSAADLRTAAKSGLEADICPHTDQDYYVIDLIAGERLQIGFETQSTLLRAALYAGPTQRFVAMLTNLTTQTFDYTATESDKHWIRIFTNVNDLVSHRYTLRWLAQDGLDYGLRNVQLSPAHLIAGQSLNLTFDVVNFATASSSYGYEVILSQGTQRTTLVSVSAQPPISESASITHRHKFSIPTIYAGDAILSLQLLVENDINLANNRQTFYVHIADACPADIYEPNGTALSAYPITGFPIAATLCEGEDDWFSLELNTPAILHIAFDHKAGDLDAYAYDAKGALVDASVTANDVEILSLFPSGGRQTFYIRITGANDSVRNNYTITLH
ncbi:MAG: hypothetical protein FWC40_07175 [Proteobacteria bacterium]|nr:hypothetical protein [Pseudomonadota bacterium]